MRSKFVVYAVTVAVLASLGSAGCKTPFWKKKSGPGASGGGTTGMESPVPVNPQAGIETGERPINPEMQRGQFAPVYFDYDSARIKPSEVAKLQTVADYLKANPGKSLIVEGNCDERGTAEYNRALGERRALAARDELVKMGVEAGRITTISYGNERPVDLTHNETAWSRNRRDDFVISG